MPQSLRLFVAALLTVGVLAGCTNETILEPDDDDDQPQVQVQQPGTVTPREMTIPSKKQKNPG